MIASIKVPEGRSLYWGDFHKHLTGHRRGRISSKLDQADEIIDYAKQHVDIYAPLCYPFESYRIGRAEGIGVETVGQRPRFRKWWEEIERLTNDHHSPNEFVTFPAYEWHGNRTRWGDHNVIYFEEGYPLDDAWSMEELYENLSKHRAFAIPHHTAYEAEHRSKDWRVFDPEISPVMEIFSGQGASEGVHTPVPMRNNPSMGPRTSGGTFRDGLNQGHHVGVIASNDWTGLPGSWNSGLAGVWATNLTREGVWEAIESRRTYGVTGDRIRLWWEIDGRPMGSILSEITPTSATVGVDCPQSLDRIELIHNGRVVYTYNHQSESERKADGDLWRVLIEFGWGPDPRNDFRDIEQRWLGEITIDGGNLSNVVPRFSGFGQTYEVERPNRCNFDFKTSRQTTSDFPSSRAQVYHDRQGLILEIEGNKDSEVVLELEDGEPIIYSVGELREEANVVALTDEAEQQIHEEFGVRKNCLRKNSFARDLYYSNARKIKFHPAYSAAECSVKKTIDTLPTVPGDNYYYVRVSQVNGQYAWSSPIWVDR